jgi:biopolymer transport protein TolR
MRRHRKPINQINVVPYIDVMLVLLIIFMVTAPLVAPGEIELPSVGTKLTVPVQPLEVSLRRDKTFELRDRSTNPPTVARVSSRTDLVARILAKQQQQDQPVVIEADARTPYQDVMDVPSALQENGVRKVGLLARPPSK